MKTLQILLLPILGFISLAHAELFVGDFNKPLEFDIKTAGNYKIELEADVLYNEIYGGEDWEIDLSTLIDATAAQNLYFIVKAAYGKHTEKNTTDIYHFEVGHHTISATVKVGGNHPERVSADKTAWKYTVKSAEEIDYRNSIGDLQKSVDQRGSDIAGVKNDIATLQGAVSGNNGLADQVTSLKKQTDKLSDDSAQSTALILSAINGVSQQVTTVNNNVTGGNKTNQTLGIIGLSLGAAGLTAGVGIPLFLKSENNTDVSGPLNSDRESVNYVSPGKGD